MIERIVVGIDSEGLADHAVAVGLSLSDALAADLAFVHGIHVEAPLRGLAATARWSRVTAEVLAQATNACREHLRELVDRERWSTEELSSRLVVRPQSAANALLDHAAEQGADLLLIGAHRHRRVFDFGGTGRAILARSACPVWVQSEAPGEIRTLLAPVDLSPSSTFVLEMARTMASTFGAKVQVLNCFRPPLFAYDGDSSEAGSPRYVIDDVRRSEREEFEALVHDFDWRGVPVETASEEGEPWTEILARQEDFDLIVMGTHGRTGFVRTILGSVAYRVLKGAHRPILVVPLPAHAYGGDSPGEG